MSTSTPGDPLTAKSRILEAGACASQDFSPVKQICAHLNGFHVYASDPKRCVEANHYCTHLTEGSSHHPTHKPYQTTNQQHQDVRQCLIYDTPEPKAKLIGVEYMISPRLFVTLPPEERKLWHTHEFEVKSGMLIMPTPAGVPNAVWEAAETAEMKDLIPNYGKTYHFWQVDRGDPVPLGAPQLMGAFTSEEKVRVAKKGGLSELVRERDERFGVDFKGKREKRAQIADVDKHPGLLSRVLSGSVWLGLELWLTCWLSRCRYTLLGLRGRIGQTRLWTRKLLISLINNKPYTRMFPINDIHFPVPYLNGVKADGVQGPSRQRDGSNFSCFCFYTCSSWFCLETASSSICRSV